MKKILIVWGNWGPYHRARYQALREAAAKVGIEVEGMELFPKSGYYEWTNDCDDAGIHRLNVGRVESDFNPSRLFRLVLPRLRRIRPDVIFVPSYWHWSLLLNVCSRLRGARVVMMNESHAGTERARGWKRAVKGAIVRRFHAALVGGQPHRDYFASLGLDAERIYTGYDAIDHPYFAMRSDSAREIEAELRTHYNLPPRYFLSLGRMVEKKNLATLVRATQIAIETSSGFRHHLVFVGSGELEADLKHRCTKAGLPVIEHPEGQEAAQAYDPESPAAHFYGFRQIEVNPAFYAFATAFVLPSIYEEWGLVVNEAMACQIPVIVSKTAGCAPDLCLPGQTGFNFPPSDPEALASHLQTLAADSELATQLGEQARLHAAKWDCDNFARQALACARAAREPHADALA